MSKSCLIIIDMQNGVFKLKNGIFNTATIIDNSTSCLEHAIDNDIQIILTQHENNSFLLKHSEDWELIDSVKKYSAKSFIIEKKHPGIYKDTGLQDYLQQTKITDIYIGGLISNGCVKEACLDSLNHGYNVHLIKDCHSTFYANAEKIIANVNNDLDMAGIDLLSTPSFVENCA